MAKRLWTIIAVIGLLGIVVFWHDEVAQTSSSSKAPHSAEKKAKNKKTQVVLNLFGSQFLRFLKTRSDSVSVAVYDKKTGQTYTYRPNAVYCPASTIKVAIMADTLKKMQGSLTEEQEELLTTMIENSDDDAATDLWEDNGGTSAMQIFLNQLGMSHTVANEAWGLTTTTAPDMLKTMELFAYPNKILTNSERAYGLHLMENVEADQTWGVSAGVASDATLAIKNGWSPETESDWRINSLGYIDGDGRNYVISVYTIHNPTQEYGISTIEGVSKVIWQELGETASSKVKT